MDQSRFVEQWTEINGTDENAVAEWQSRYDDKAEELERLEAEEGAEV